MTRLPHLIYKPCARPGIRKFPSPANSATLPALIGDNGYDPVLGAPFPPIGYQLTQHDSAQPRLTWTVPDIIITASASVGGSRILGGTITIVATNYTALPMGTTMYLNRGYGGQASFVGTLLPALIGSSVSSGGSTPIGEFWTFTDGPPTFTYTFPPAVGPFRPGDMVSIYYSFLLTASNGLQSLSSQIVQVLVPWS